MNGLRAGPCGHRSRSRRQERAFRDAAGPGGPRRMGRQGPERVVKPSLSGLLKKPRGAILGIQATDEREEITPPLRVWLPEGKARR